MNVNEAIERLNTVSSAAARREPLRRAGDLRAFFKNPPRHDSFPQDELIRPITEAFRNGDESARPRLVSKLNAHAQSAFLAYAADLAVLAVRRDSPELVVLGLVALAIEGGRSDIRDSIVVLAKLHRSAVKLGIDASKAFGDVASMTAANQLRIEMARFPHRPPATQILEAFCLREEGTAGDFNYVQVVPSTHARKV